MSLYSAASGIQLLSNQFPTHKVEKDLVTIFGRILLRHDWWLNEFVRSLTTKNVWEVNFRIYLFWPKICWDLGPGVKCNCYHISWYRSTVDAKNFLYMLSRQEECHCISCTLFVSGISSRHYWPYLMAWGSMVLNFQKRLFKYSSLSPLSGAPLLSAYGICDIMYVVYPF